MLAGELDDYVAMVAEAQRKYPELNIKLGLEVDFIPGHERWIQTMAGRYDWDYFIGSVHYVSGNWDFDNPAKLDQWNDRDPFECGPITFNASSRQQPAAYFKSSATLICQKNSATALSKIALRCSLNSSPPVLKPNLHRVKHCRLRKDCAEIYPSLQFCN